MAKILFYGSIEEATVGLTRVEKKSMKELFRFCYFRLHAKHGRAALPAVSTGQYPVPS